MKEVIVVVDEKEKPVITGTNLKVINPMESAMYAVLVVMEGSETIAVFHEWLYWKQLK